MDQNMCMGGVVCLCVCVCREPSIVHQRMLKKIFLLTWMVPNDEWTKECNGPREIIGGFNHGIWKCLLRNPVELLCRCNRFGRLLLLLGVILVVGGQLTPPDGTGR